MTFDISGNSGTLVIEADRLGVRFQFGCQKFVPIDSVRKVSTVLQLQIFTFTLGQSEKSL